MIKIMTGTGANKYFNDFSLFSKDPSFSNLYPKGNDSLTADASSYACFVALLAVPERVSASMRMVGFKLRRQIVPSSALYESLPICSNGTYPLGVGITTSFTLAKSLRLFGSRRSWMPIVLSPA